MARKKSTSTKQKQPEPKPRHGRFIGYCFVLLLAAVIVLLWMSLLSFHPNDWPASLEYPRQPIRNRVGAVGAFVAYNLRYWLGGGVYVGTAFATIAVVAMLLRRRIRELPWRVIGVAVLTATTSAGIYLADPEASRNVSQCTAGILGAAIGDMLLRFLNPTGGWVTLAFLFGIGLFLSADWLLIRAPWLAIKAWRNRHKLRAVGSILPVRRALQEKPASASKLVAAPSKPTPKTTEEKPEEKKRKLPLFGTKPKPAAQSKPKPKKQEAPKQQFVSKENQDYAFPPKDLLHPPQTGYAESQESQAMEKRAVLQQTLDDFNVGATVVGHMTGPVITMYEMSLEPGVKVSAVSRLSNDISRALAVPDVRVVSPLPGRDTIGIEVPNMEKEIVRLRELMEMEPDAEKSMFLPLYLGKDAEGQAIIADLARMPHMLIAGTTGSGKSVCINAIIMAMLLKRKPEDVRLILVDPKMVEMAAFEKIPHLLCPIVSDMHKAEDILEWAATKMDERYDLLREAGVRNIASYNQLSEEELYERFGVETDEEKKRVPKHIPYYVIIVDELADLIMTSSKEVESHIIRIAQKARAVGIHLILATQRPSVNVVTGLIKSNMPCRTSFRVASRQESRIVLDQNGAEVLLGQGDMLFLQPGTSNLMRAQGTYVDDNEIRKVVKELKKKREPEYHPEIMKINSQPVGELSDKKDDLFDKAVEIVLSSQRGSVSLLQRRLSIGYSRASRIIDQMADSGLLGDYKGSQARECLMTLDEWKEFQQSIASDQSGDSALNGEPTSV